MWLSFFELNTGPVAKSGRDQRPDTRPIEAPNRSKSKNLLAIREASTHDKWQCKPPREFYAKPLLFLAIRFTQFLLPFALHILRRDISGDLGPRLPGLVCCNRGHYTKVL